MITEEQLEQLCLDCFRDQGCEYAQGPDIAPDSNNPERNDYRQVICRQLGAIRLKCK
jgi:type I restriction enzyme R subunit